ncbi:MAG TPA: hypothetical protein DEQ20_10550 [Desulfobulbaceae bacterium]|nr:MAG: hypothetical protein A2520_06435 [Deltaproteobacteria bacterium RIFOXYD12_FULL_53_23]HCC55341.1 hypothetical protein [Desulfobulbaceae bacterium]
MLTRRTIHHLDGALQLAAGWPRWRKFERKIYCCLTVDLDAHGHRNAFKKGLPFLLDLFSQKGLEGAITWFYNCREKELGAWPDPLAEMQRRKDEVALHCHLEDLPDARCVKDISAEIQRDKIDLENITGQAVSGFRSGQLLRTPQIFAALNGCSLRYDSSCTFGRTFTVKGTTMDDRKISGNDSVFPLDNGLLEFPIWEPFPQPRQIALTGPPYFITNLVHPFNLVCNGQANQIIQHYYRTIIHILQKIPAIEFTTLSSACQIWNQQTSRQS